MSKQTNIYLDEQTKKEVKILIAQTGKWRNMSDFIREAAREKLDRELKNKN